MKTLLSTAPAAAAQETATGLLRSDAPVSLSAGCRVCETPLQHVLVDLGMSPLSNSFRTRAQLNEMEPFYPLRVYVCAKCLLVQLESFQSPDEIFTDYAYFSSYSDSWLEHARSFVDMAIPRFGLDGRSQVLEIASNDGYLLQYFVEQSVPVLGLEPAANVAAAAIRKGIPTRVQFFGRRAAEQLVAEGLQADLVIGNNVLAHTPYLNDFVEGLRLVLKRNGVVTLEFPHLLRLMAGNQFDTIYHEHFSYFSLTAVDRIFARHGLTIFHVDELPTHGGSLRIHARHAEDETKPVDPGVASLAAEEAAAGLLRLDPYVTFGRRVERTKRQLLEFLIAARNAGKTIVGYGAPAKGNTLLNYCGIGTDFIDYTVDRSPHKQGLFLPGTHIPICHPARIAETRPDYVLILPWNLAGEIMQQMAHVHLWGGEFVVPIPEVRVYAGALGA